MKKLGFEKADQCYHLSYGMVELPEGKMKSREGTVVDADDLMEEMATVAQEVSAEQGKLEGLPEAERNQLFHIIGMAALKYFLLRVDPKKNMLFDPKESIDFNGNTGPSVQYTYVRTQAIQRRYAEAHPEFNPKEANSEGHTLSTAESEVVAKMYEWPAVLRTAATTFNPADIAHYSYDLAKLYNAFYQDHQIVKETDEQARNFRLALTYKTGVVIREAMRLLGISMPDRM